MDLKNIPLITDILDEPELYYEDLNYLEKLETEHSMWDPTKLNQHQISYYLGQMKKLWPFES